MKQRSSFPSLSPMVWGTLVALLGVLLFVSPSSSEASLSFSSPFKSLHSRFRTLANPIIPTNCDAPLLNSLSLQSLPFYSNQVIDLDLDQTFVPTIPGYFTTRAFSQETAFLRVNLGSTTPADATVTLFLNGKSVDVHPPVPSIDVGLIPGVNNLEVDVTTGTCTSVYTVAIEEAPLVQGETPPVFPDCATAPPTEVTGFTIGLSAAGSSTVVPLTVTPPYSPSTSPFYVAFEGTTDFTGGEIHFTPTFNAGGWFRYSINRGPLIYGSPSGQEIVAPLIDGTNLIQFDVIQPPPCGDYIAEYSLTIYPGPPQGGETVPCTPFELSSLSLNLIPWSSNQVIPVPVNLQSGVYDYTFSRTSSYAILQLQATGPPGVAVNVFLNGAIVEPNPLPVGTTLDLVLVPGVDTIRIDLVQGQCTTSYTLTFNDEGNGPPPCPDPNGAVAITGASVSVTDVNGNTFPLTITPAWDGGGQFFYVAYIGNHDVDGGSLTLTFTGATPGSAWLRYAINHGVYIYGATVGTPITAPLVPGTNLIQLDALQFPSCGNYIAEYSITIYQGPAPPPSR